MLLGKAERQACNSSWVPTSDANLDEAIKNFDLNVIQSKCETEGRIQSTMNNTILLATLPLSGKWSGCHHITFFEYDDSALKTDPY
jgi:hypothetical protein